MANYPQELAQDAVCQSHTGHMTGLWFLLARLPRLNTNDHDLLNGRIFEGKKKKITEHKMRVLIFSTTFICNTSHSKKK